MSGKVRRISEFQANAKNKYMQISKHFTFETKDRESPFFFFFCVCQKIYMYAGISE